MWFDLFNSYIKTSTKETNMQTFTLKYAKIEDQSLPCVLSYCMGEVFLLYRGCSGPGLGPANINLKSCKYIPIGDIQDIPQKTYKVDFQH